MLQNPELKVYGFSSGSHEWHTMTSMIFVGKALSIMLFGADNNAAMEEQWSQAIHGRTGIRWSGKNQKALLEALEKLRLFMA